MKTIFIFFIVLLFSPLARASNCLIKTHKRIVKADHLNESDLKQIIKSSSCNSKIQKRFVDLVVSANGVLTNKLVADHFENENVTIFPTRVRVESIGQAADEKLLNKEDWSFRALTPIRGSGIITLNDNDSLDINCGNCHFTGEKSLKLIKKNHISGKQKVIWFNAKLTIRVRGLVALGHIKARQGNLSPELFDWQYIYTTKPQDIFTNKSKIVFYTLNKSLAPGEPLLFRNLSSANLVKLGQPAKIELTSKTMNLSGTAIPMRSAKFGDTIQLRSSKSKKIIVGKVIDFNKVQIEL